MRETPICVASASCSRRSPGWKTPVRMPSRITSYAMSPTVRNARPWRSTIAARSAAGSATHDLFLRRARLDLLREPPDALRRQRQLRRIPAEQASDGGRDRGADRVAGALAAALRAERADPVAALR